MAVGPHSIDIVIADMSASSIFYSALGLAVPDGNRVDLFAALGDGGHE